MAYQAVEEIQVRCEKENIPFWKAVQLEDCGENGITEEDSWQQSDAHVEPNEVRVLMRTILPRDPEVVWSEKKAGLWTSIVENEKPLCGDFVLKGHCRMR